MTAQQEREQAAKAHAESQWKEQPIERAAAFENWENCQQDFIAGAEWEAERDKWRCAQIDPPEIGMYVLVLIHGDVVLKGQLMENGWTAFYSDGQTLCGIDNPLQWQPLPLPPKTTSDGK